MSGMSIDLATDLFNAVLRNTAYTGPSELYLAVHTDISGEPTHPGKTTPAAFASEASYSGYQRQLISFTAPTGSDVAQGDNDIAAVFAELGSGETEFPVTGLSVWSAERGANDTDSGTMLLAGPVDLVKQIQAGDAPLVSVGSLVAVFGQPIP